MAEDVKNVNNDSEVIVIESSGAAKIEALRVAQRGGELTTKAEGTVRSTANNQFEVDDIITFPTDYEGVMVNQSFGTDAKGNPVTVTSIFCDTINEKTGEKKVVRFFLSTLSKMVQEYAEDEETGKLVFVANHYAKGTAVQFANQFVTNEDLANGLKGLKIKVLSIQKIQSRKFGSTTELSIGTVPTLDIVE